MNGQCVVVRRLTQDDAAALQLLLESNAGYSLRVQGASPVPGAADQIFRALPAGVTPAQKWGLGLWEGQELLAFADILLDWPQPGTAYIGLLITAGSRQGQGLGRRLHEAVCAQLHERGSIGRLRLSIVATNAAVAEPLWRALGYSPTGESRLYRAGTVTSTAHIWERALAAG